MVGPRGGLAGRQTPERETEGPSTWPVSCRHCVQQAPPGNFTAVVIVCSARCPSRLLYCFASPASFCRPDDIRVITRTAMP